MSKDLVDDGDHYVLRSRGEPYVEYYDQLAMVSAVAPSALQVEGTGDTYVGRERQHSKPQSLWGSQEDRTGEFGYPELSGMAYCSDWNLVLGNHPFFLAHEEWAWDVRSVSWGSKTWIAHWDFHKARRIDDSVRICAGSLISVPWCANAIYLPRRHFAGV